MLQEGVIVGRPGDSDPGAITLLRKLSRVSRKRWPETAVEAPRLMPKPLPKAEAPA
jgi:coenzyme F420 hydrogenase subunit beta